MWGGKGQHGFLTFRQEWKIRETERKYVIRNLILNTIFSISNKKQNRWWKHPPATVLSHITLCFKKKKKLQKRKKIFQHCLYSMFNQYEI